MDRPEVSRRDVLRSGTVAIGVASAGCTLPGAEGGAGTLAFEGVDAAFRERADTVFERLTDLVGATIREETTIRLIDTAEMRDRSVGGALVGETTTQRLAHRALGVVETLDPDVPFEFSGAYYPDSATILLVADDEADVDDQLLAHELCHAIQFQAGGVPSWEHGWSAGFDRHTAQQALLEGTAMYAEDEYVGGCDGAYATCELSRPTRIDLQGIDPALLVTYGSYFNGHEFASALDERSGWDAIWEAHGDPPVSTGQILRPEWYPSWQPESVPTPSEPGPPWTRLDTERLGTQALFVTLWNEGVLPETAAFTGDPDDADEVYSTLVRYRSELTDRWRGDAFTGFERSDGRYGWLWRIGWEDASAAETGYERFREWATTRGSVTDVDDVWVRDDGVEALALDGDDVLIGTAPTRDDLDAIAPGLAG